MKRIAILGSTGSIGQNVLKVVDHLPEEFQVYGLAAKSNTDRLVEQILRYKPKLVAVYDADKAQIVRKRFPHIKVLEGIEGLVELATHSDVDQVISAMTGTIGILPTIKAIEKGKKINLANKEVLVSAGELVMSLAKKHKALLVPIDSEQCALFQCLKDEKKNEVHRLVITASGGPFRDYSEEQLQNITTDDALNHPTWRMGPKITIDSSTLMNKGLEVIEAHWLFGIPLDKIDVVVHPQSIIHSLVEFIDGSLIAQLSENHMILPIQYAMTYPERKQSPLAPFDFIKNGKLQFYSPDIQKFRCLQLAYSAARAGGSLPCYMNAANEILVGRFLNKEFTWQSIADKLEDLMDSHNTQPVSSLDDILSIDEIARKEAQEV
jgi:1-deoxy-D-xylulose-5-phosphate reductoisomerase